MKALYCSRCCTSISTRHSSHSSYAYFFATKTRRSERIFGWTLLLVSNLELFDPLQKDGSSLCKIIDDTRTPMGGRSVETLAKISSYALEKEIEARQNCVEELLYQQNELRTNLTRQSSSSSGDLERLASKVALRRANTSRSYYAYNKSLLHTREVQDLL